MERLDLLGAVTAYVIFVSSIVTFAVRIWGDAETRHWTAIPLLMMALPLTYLLIKAPEVDRGVLYYVQVGLMLLWIIGLFLLDYVFELGFRDTQWMVITFVVFYVAGLGGMIGVASLAGTRWMAGAVILFFVTAVMAFVSRSATGI